MFLAFTASKLFQRKKKNYKSDKSEQMI